MDEAGAPQTLVGLRRIEHYPLRNRSSRWRFLEPDHANGDGSEHPFHGTYREILCPHRLVYTECYDMPQFGSPEWLTTVTFDETPTTTLVTHTIQHKSREVRDGHLQAGMQEGTIQALTRLNELTAAMEQAQ